MTFLILILLIEIGPAITLVRWRVALLKKGQPPESVASPQAAKRIAMLSHIQALLVVLMVFAAAGMARGLGMGVLVRRELEGDASMRHGHVPRELDLAPLVEAAQVQSERDLVPGFAAEVAPNVFTQKAGRLHTIHIAEVRGCERAVRAAQLAERADGHLPGAHFFFECRFAVTCVGPVCRAVPRRKGGAGEEIGHPDAPFGRGGGRIPDDLDLHVRVRMGGLAAIAAPVAPSRAQATASVIFPMRGTVQCLCPGDRARYPAATYAVSAPALPGVLSKNPTGRIARVLFLWLKALHIVFVVTWFAGLFYLPRLFIYHAAATDSVSVERFIVMERRLFGIMTIGAALAALFGLSMLVAVPGLSGVRVDAREAHLRRAARRRITCGA